MKDDNQFDLFNKIKDNLLSIDPISFIEKYLTVDGKKFNFTAGWKPFADIYRYIGIKALEPNSEPVILVKGRQVGGTTLAAALEMYFMGSGRFGAMNRPPMRIAHIWPRLDYTFNYSKTKLNSIITQSVPAKTDGKKNFKSKSHMESLFDSSSQSNSAQFKQFIGGNHIWIESAGLEGERLRSITADCIFFDEVQDIRAGAIANCLKILSKAQYGKVGDGIQLYFGTPKQKNSDYYRMWQASSQQYYQLGCEKCKNHFPLYTPGSNEWENIWIHTFIVRCTHCGHEQDKRDAAGRGKWVATNTSGKCSYIGFHINQLYIPEFPREKIIAEKPENHPINTERAYQNEVLGEFFQGQSGIMSPEDIIQKCGDIERKFAGYIQPNENKLTFLGIDIGAKSDLQDMVDSKRIQQGQSYSTAVVLTLEGANKLNIVRALKFQKNDLASKTGIVEELMKRYNITLAVCDIGYANDFNEILQTQFGDKFLSSMASGKITDHIKYNDQVFPKLINFEKDHYIGEVYDQMKKGNIRFPLGNYEQICWLIEHCTSMEIKPSMSRSGDVIPHYVKGNTPNDGFASLINAYLAFKFYVSNGFKIKNPQLYSTGKSGKLSENAPPIASGFIPGMR